MTSESTEQAMIDIQSRVHYWCVEGDLNFAELIGILEFIKLDVMNQANEELDDMDGLEELF